MSDTIDVIGVLCTHLRARAVLWLHCADCLVVDGVLVIRTPYESAAIILRKSCVKELTAAAADCQARGWNVEWVPHPVSPPVVDNGIRIVRQKDLF